MIKYEFNTLVLDSSHTEEDQSAIDQFVDQSIVKDRLRIIDELYSLSSHGNLQIAKFKLKEIINNEGK
jgi:hypothetical protein